MKTKTKKQAGHAELVSRVVAWQRKKGIAPEIPDQEKREALKNSDTKRLRNIVKQIK